MPFNTPACPTFPPDDLMAGAGEGYSVQHDTAWHLGMVGVRTVWRACGGPLINRRALPHYGCCWPVITARTTFPISALLPPILLFDVLRNIVFRLTVFCSFPAPVDSTPPFTGHALPGLRHYRTFGFHGADTTEAIWWNDSPSLPRYRYYGSNHTCLPPLTCNI